MLSNSLRYSQLANMSWSDGSAVASQIIAALIVGLLIAYGLQLLLTNLGIAVGLSIYRFRQRLGQKGRKPTDNSLDGSKLDSNRLDPKLQTASENSTAQRNSLMPSFGAIAGLSILLTVNGVLFAACFLATRFIQVHDWLSGAIVGAVIWAAYFSLLLWLSTAAITSLFSKLLGFTVTGISGLISLIRNGLGQRSNFDPKTLAALRQQVQISIDTDQLQQTLDEYLAALPQPGWDAIRADLRTLVEQSSEQLNQQNRFNSCQPFDRDTAVKLIQQRSNLENDTVNQAVDALEEIWRETIDSQVVHSVEQKSEESLESQSELPPPIAELHQQLESYLRYTNPKKLTPKRIERKLQKLMATVQSQSHSSTLNLPRLNQASLSAVLSRRKGLSKKQQRQILQVVERIWTRAATSLVTQAASTAVSNLMNDQLELDQLEPDQLEPDQLESGQSRADAELEMPSENSSNVLIEKVADYLGSALELPYATKQLQQNLTHWFAHFKSEEWLSESWQTLRQQLSGKTLTEGLEQWQQSLAHLWQEQWQEQFSQAALQGLPFQSLSQSTQAALQSHIGRVKQQMAHHIETTQQQIQTQIQHWQQQVEQRLEATRKTAAAAAWWLFTIALTAALSSATAGGLAATVNATIN